MNGGDCGFQRCGAIHHSLPTTHDSLLTTHYSPPTLAINSFRRFTYGVSSHSNDTTTTIPLTVKPFYANMFYGLVVLRAGHSPLRTRGLPKSHRCVALQAFSSSTLLLTLPLACPERSRGVTPSNSFRSNTYRIVGKYPLTTSMGSARLSSL
jgi:hypothetical protein